MASLTRAGVIALPWGPESTAIPMVGAEDVARVAAAVLTGPTLPGHTVARMIAGAVTNRESAEALSQILNRSVDYVKISEEHGQCRFGSRESTLLQLNTSPTCGATYALSRRNIRPFITSPTRSKTSSESHRSRWRNSCGSTKTRSQRRWHDDVGQLHCGVSRFACTRAQLKGRGSPTTMALTAFRNSEAARVVNDGEASTVPASGHASRAAKVGIRSKDRGKG